MGIGNLRERPKPLPQPNATPATEMRTKSIKYGPRGSWAGSEGRYNLAYRLCLVLAGLPMNELTRILSAVERGDPRASEQLLPLLYDELRKLALQKMSKEPSGHTLQATALVHEAYLRLVANPGDPGSGSLAQRWDGRGHFFAAAAEAMRRILIESARRKKRLKHGGGQVILHAEADIPLPERPELLLALDEALNRLAATNPQAAEVVKLRFFAGHSNADTASILGISPRKATQVWAYARAWLRADLGDTFDFGVRDSS